MFDYLNLDLNFGSSLTLNPSNTSHEHYITTIFYDVAPFLLIPNSFEIYQKFRKAKFWYNIRRSERLLQQKGSIQFVIARNSDQIKMHMKNAFDLMDKRWEGKYSSAYYFKKGGANFYLNSALVLAEKNKFILALLYVDDICIAFSYNILIDSRLHVYMHANTTNSKYSKLSTGKIFYKHLIKYCCEEQFSELDFMIGGEPYKYEWTSDSRSVYYVIKTKKCPLLIPLHYGKVIIRYIYIRVIKNKYIRKIIGR